MIRTILLICSAAAAGGTAYMLSGSETGLHRAAIVAQPVPLSRRDPAVMRSGKLRYLGGWSLTSRDRRFGGLSSMAVAGRTVLAVSDAGDWVRFRLGPRGAIADGMIGRLPDGPGKGDTKKDRDAESLARDPATGRVWIAFEGGNAIWRYDRALARAEAHAAPRAMKKWPSNGGAEAMARLADGRFVVFSEDQRGPDNSTAALLFAGDPAAPGKPPVAFGYRAPAGYAVTDATPLPDGRLLLLHRRASLIDGFSAAISVLDPARIAKDRAIEGTEVARLGPPLTVDNMEAIAVTQERGELVLWLMSDDNFSFIQRTLLMRFALEP